MKISREKLAGTLRNVYPFTDLDENQINYLLEDIELVFFSAGKMIFLEAAFASHLYIVYQGQVEILKEKKHAFSQRNHLGEYTLFGEDALLQNKTRRTAARAITDVILLKLKGEHLSRLASSTSVFKNKLALILSTYEYLIKKDFDQSNRESLFYIGQSHPVVLILKSLLAVIIACGVGIILVSLFNNRILSYTGFLFIGGIIAFFPLLWIGWQYFEWSNDHFFFTDKRIVFRQRAILSSESKHEIHLSAVESFQVRKNILGRGLGFGELDIKTYTGSTRIPNVPDLNEVQHLLSYLIDRKKSLEELEAKQEIKGEIRARLNADSNFRNRIASEADTFQTPMGFDKGDLDESDNTIFRTHWTILFSKIFVPLFLCISVVSLYLYLSINQSDIVGNLFFHIISIISSITLVLWSAYRFIDWRNDIYVIAGEQLIDVNRKPFGTEEKSTALLKNIQSIRYKKNGAFGLLFNFGTVYIRIGDEEFTFDNVHYPADVQEMIFSAKEHYYEDEKAKQRRLQQKKAVDWIDSYHQVINEEKNKNGDLSNRTANSP